MDPRAAVLEAPRLNLSEDHLGEAPIKPGDSVTIKERVAVSRTVLHLMAGFRGYRFFRVYSMRSSGSGV